MFSITCIISKGPKLDAKRVSKVSRPLIANMILNVNISSFSEWKYNYLVMTFTIAREDTGDDSFAFPYAWGRHYWAHQHSASISCLHSSRQAKDTLECTNAKTCRLSTLQWTCRPLCNKHNTPHNTIEQTRAKIPIPNALECQVSWVTLTGEVVSH